MSGSRTEVTVDDLTRLGVLHEILALLNEPAASANALGNLIDSLPVLAARVDARYRQRCPHKEATSPVKLVLLGNRVFESILMELLEDLTVLRAEAGG